MNESEWGVRKEIRERMERRSQRVLPGVEAPPGSLARTALEHAQMLQMGYGVRNGDGQLIINGEEVKPEPVVEEMPF